MHLGVHYGLGVFCGNRHSSRQQSLGFRAARQQQDRQRFRFKVSGHTACFIRNS